MRGKETRSKQQTATNAILEKEKFRKTRRIDDYKLLILAAPTGRDHRTSAEANNP